MSEAGGTANAGNTAVGAGNSGGASGGPAANSGNAGAPWYGDKVDQVTIGFWQNKGIDANDPVAVATKLTEFYRNSEKFVGAPPEEMIRIPKANAAEADIRAYWGKIGVPAEAKDYDLSTVKRSDGKELDPSFSDAFRSAAHSARVPKDQAAGMMTALVKQMEAVDATKAAEKTSYVKTQQEELDRNWGTSKAINLARAEEALQHLGKAAGMTPEQAKNAWDALTIVGGINASHALEMLRVVSMGGGRSTEPSGLIGQDQTQLNNGIMSVEQAIAKIESLKMDKDWYGRLSRGGAAEKKEWTDLHKIAGAELNRRRSGYAA